MRVVGLWTALALLLCVGRVCCEAYPRSSSLRISRSKTVRTAAKSYFLSETVPQIPPSSGFLWPTTPPSARIKYSEEDDEDGDDDSEVTSSKIKVKPYKSHYKLKVKPLDSDDDDSDERAWMPGWLYSYLGETTGVLLSVDVGVRVFVRAMDAEDMAGEDELVAKVVVLGDSREIVDAAVDLVAVEPPVNASSTAAFRIQSRGVPVSGPLVTAVSGRVLVQVLVNTQAAQLQVIHASGDSVVVVEESALRSLGSLFVGSESLELTASGSSRLFVKMSGIYTTAMELTARDTAALVVQSSSSLTISDLQLREHDTATLAVVTPRLVSAIVAASMASSSPASGALCVHTTASSSVSILTANASSSGGLLQWASSSNFPSTCEMLTINESGDGASIDLSSIQTDSANVTIQGDGSDAVVNAQRNLVSTVSATSHVTNVAGKSRASGDTRDPRCSIATLSAQFPLPLERAAAISLSGGHNWETVSTSPNEKTTQVEREEAPLPIQQRVPQSQPRQDPFTLVDSSAAGTPEPEGFVNGSLHMLGSMPYVDAIVVFLVSAWILHHLLQCYDRRQRRRRYTPLHDAPSPAVDRVWI